MAVQRCSNHFGRINNFAIVSRPLSLATRTVSHCIVYWGANFLPEYSTLGWKRETVATMAFLNAHIYCCNLGMKSQNSPYHASAFWQARVEERAYVTVVTRTVTSALPPFDGHFFHSIGRRSKFWPCDPQETMDEDTFIKFGRVRSRDNKVRECLVKYHCHTAVHLLWFLYGAKYLWNLTLRYRYISPTGYSFFYECALSLRGVRTILWPPSIMSACSKPLLAKDPERGACSEPRSYVENYGVCLCLSIQSRQVPLVGGIQVDAHNTGKINSQTNVASQMAQVCSNPI